MKKMIYGWIALGSAIGGALRYWCGEMMGSIGSNFPWGTVFINVLGSFLIGIIFYYDGRWGINPELRLFLTVGFCGGYTTFSAFSLQTFSFLQQGEFLKAGMNVVLSVTFCLISVCLGFWIAAFFGSVKF